jgi:hypothetical protein
VLNARGLNLGVFEEIVEHPGQVVCLTILVLPFKKRLSYFSSYTQLRYYTLCQSLRFVLDLCRIEYGSCNLGRKSIW